MTIEIMEPETATVILTLKGGVTEQLNGVDFSEARRARNHFSDWASLGGVRASNDAWPGSRTFQEANMVTGEWLVAPYAAILAMRLVPEVH